MRDIIKLFLKTIIYSIFLVLWKKWFGFEGMILLGFTLILLKLS